MRHLLTLTSVLLLLSSTAVFSSPSNNQNSGSASLQNEPGVKLYEATPDGVPQVVSGDLGFSAVPGAEKQAIVGFFEKNRSAYGMTSPADEIELLKTDRDQLGMRHTRIEQRYHGLEVIGGDLIAHFSPQGELKTVNGYYLPDIDIPVTPSVSAERATETAVADLRDIFGTGSPSIPELVVFPWEDQDYLAWRLWLNSDSLAGRWEYFVDATTGEVIYKANRIMFDEEVGTGFGVMGDPRNHIDVYYSNGLYLMIDYSRQADNNIHGHDGQMAIGNYIKTQVAGITLPGATASDADNVWDLSDDQAPAVDGQVYAGLYYDWVLRVFGRNGPLDNGGKMLTIVNYIGEGTNNAYWDGQRIVVWGWSAGRRSLAGCPDVIGHEWSHAVTEYTSGLIYQKEAGALNESFSDMMGAAFEFAHDSMDTPDWYMAENGMVNGNGFRNMADPHEYNDPDYYGTTDPYWVDVESCSPDDQNDYCGVHTNSGVGNKWFYLLSDGGTHHGVTVTGIGVENAVQIAYRANAYYWTSTSDYHDAALGTIMAANDLDPTGAWTSVVADAWKAVGVAAPIPHLAFAFDGGQPESVPTGLMSQFDVAVSGVSGATAKSGTGRLHYSIDGAPFTSVAMTTIAVNNYRGQLPAVTCDQNLRYYVSATDTYNRRFYYPDTTDAAFVSVASGTTAVFEDDFENDEGWTVDGSATAGQWERGIPDGLGDRGDPTGDYDGSGSCFLTGNDFGDSDVDDGSTILTSPTFSLTEGDAFVSYARWFSTVTGANPFSDTMKVYVSDNDGSDWVLVETVGPLHQVYGDWYRHTFRVSDFVTPTDQMKLRFEVTDTDPASIVEAAVDAVSVVRYDCVDWMCGDLDGDNKINLSDITSLIASVYLGGPDPVPKARGNVDGSSDGKINLSDITAMIVFVYFHGNQLHCQ